MKMKFLITIIVLFTTILFAQSQTLEHLAFKGVPIDGTLDEYVSKMKKSGFSHLKTDHGTALLKGDFAGYKNCMVGVSTLTQKDLVHKIAVIFPIKDTWSTLSGNYFDLKEMLTEKYGKPFDVVEEFDGYSQPRTDERRMLEVKTDNCKYYSIWETDKGKIQLSIEHESITRCFVKLGYFDRINGEAIKKQAMSDL